MKAPLTAAVTFTTLLAAAAPASAQIGRVAGIITDEAGKPIRGATITAQNREHTPNTISATSDAKGRYSMLGLKRGQWVFVVQAPGYETAATPMDVVTIKPNPPLNVRMLKGSAPAPPGPLTNVDVRQLQEKLDRAAALATSDVDGAIAAYRDVLSQAPALTSVHFQIATLLERKQDTAGALAAYQELARIEPTNQRALAAIARLTRQ